MTADSTRPSPENGPSPCDPLAPTRYVGIGASAGGLEALELLFSHMPKDSGMAFIVIQHLSPDFKSVMDELLARRTSMPVRMAQDGLRVEPNTIYLLPRKTEMTIQGGALQLAQREAGQTLLLPIDTFFQSLAADAGERAVGVVLSGTGSDGSRGVRAIHQAGGLVFAQSEESAKFDGMPRAAADTEIVDFILPPERIPELLVAYSGGSDQPGLVRVEGSEFSEVFALLKDHHGVDFHSYKPTTMRRRIERRMVLREIRDLESYVNLLRGETEEIEALYIDLLIGVTRFFRDPPAFEQLGDIVIPRILAGKSSGEEVRAWVCGCATGEEAYSVAILLSEAARAEGRDLRIKVFATDVHRRTLDRAARGTYSREEVDMIPEGLRERYFINDGETVRVKPELRQRVVFSEHNLTGDPPFTKIDLVTCRNLLIYLQNSAQRKAISLFHFALNVGGVLLLGPSESLGTLEDEFDLIDRHWKIYSKRRDVRVFATPRELPPALSSNRVVMSASAGGRSGIEPRLARAYDSLLAEYMPPSVLVDASRTLLHTFGDVGRYFVRPQGRPSFDLVDMLTGDLRISVAAALQRSVKENRKVTYQGVQHETAVGTVRLNLVINPMADRMGAGNLYHILFEELTERVRPPADNAEVEALVEDYSSVETPTRQRIRDLELELQYSKEHLQTTVEELETSNEELQATNEELLASNEELQSTNEELHSVNEELYTVNAEYEKKNRELIELNTDIDNLLQSTDIGTLFLDDNLEVRKFTPAIRIAFNLLPQDIGRSIADISYRVKGHPTLWEDADAVRREHTSLDRRVRAEDGRDLLLRLRPYLISETNPSGVVLTFVDITELTRAQQRLVESEERFRRIANSTPALLWMVDADQEGVYFNAQWSTFTGLAEESLAGAKWRDCVNEEDWSGLSDRLTEASEAADPFVVEIRIRNAEGRFRWVRVSAVPRVAETEFLGYILTAVDIDDIRNAAEVLRSQVRSRTRDLERSEELFRLIGEVATDGFWDWDLAADTVHLSPSFKSLFGYQDDEIENSLAGWRGILDPGDREAADEAMRRHREGDDAGQLVVRGMHRDGSQRWLILRIAAMRDAEGRCYRMIGTHTDITAQKEAEEQIRASEQRFRSVFETDLMGIGIVDADMRLVECNQRLLDFTGMTTSSLPVAIQELSDEAGFAVSRQLIAEARKEGASSIGEKSYLKRTNGERTIVRIGYGRLDSGNGDLVVIAEDISAEKASKRALEQSEERLAQAIEATQVGLFDWPLPVAEATVAGSPEFFRMFGFGAEVGEVPAAALLGRMHPDDRERLVETLGRASESLTDLNLDLRVFCEGADLRWIYVRARFLEGKESGGPRIVGSTQEVTERYASQASLQLKTELLEKSNQDLEQFAYIASHDLKEPLRTVTGYLQILSARFRDEIGGEGREFVLRAVDAANRMHALIDGLLEFSRIGRVDLKMERVELREIVEIVTGQLQAAIAESSARVEVEDLPAVKGDATLLARVFLNLLGNSIKFSAGQAPRIRVYWKNYDGHVRVFVEDNGIGIDPKFADRIFVIFQRLHTREEYPGTGIGLSVCRKIMERHGGCIWLEKDSNAVEAGGTTIGLAFPT